MHNKLALSLVAGAAIALTGCGSGGGGSTIDTLIQTPSSNPSTSTPTTSQTTLASTDVDERNLAIKSYSYTQNATTGALGMTQVASAGTVDVYYKAGSDGKPANVTVTLKGVNGVSSAITFSAADFTAFPNVLDQNTAKKMLYHAQKSSSGGAVEVFDPTKLTNWSGTVTGFSYATLGLWTLPGDASGLTGIGGVAPMGHATTDAALPKTGAATYRGVLIGNYLPAASTTSYGRVAADASATADFAARNVTFATTNTHVQAVSGTTTATTANPNLDLTGTLTWSAGTNRLESTTLTTKGGSTLPMSGSASGKFFGPAAQELGGSYFISGTGGRMTGGFLLKQ